MSRRGENIFKRKDGRWEARFIHHYEAGKAKYRYLYGSSYAEVKSKRAAELAVLRVGSLCGNQQTATFKQIADVWLAEKRSKVKEATYTRYYRNVYVYLLPELGAKNVAGISHPLLCEFTNKLMASGGKNAAPLSAKTVGDILCVLKAIMSFGRANGYCCAELHTISYPKRMKGKATILPEDIRCRIEEQLWDSEDCVSLGILF